MSDYAIRTSGLGKMYRLYRNPMDRAIDLIGVSKWMPWRQDRFVEFWALRDMNLEVKRGERLGLIGRNGAGKSTLLKIISGNVFPTEGEVSVNGKVQALMELGTGFHPEFTGRENIQASLAYQNLTTREIQNKTDEIIDFAELDRFIDQPVKTFSAGMYARLGFSTATSIEPEILIIDEVLGAGDAYFASKCFQRMKDLTDKKGTTVIFVSHDLGSVQQLCDRVVWVDRGQVVDAGDPVETIKQYYASILAQEKLRLMARNNRGDGNFSDDSQDTLVTFSLSVKGGEDGSENQNYIRRISITSDDNYMETILLGSPMDNDASYAGYLNMQDVFSAWGDPDKVNGQRVRSIKYSPTQENRATFVFRIPNDLLNKGSFQMEIEHMVSNNCAAEVGYYDGEAHQQIGMLSASDGAGWQVDKMEISLFLSANGDDGEAIDVSEEFDVQRPIIDENSPVVLHAAAHDKFFSILATIREARIVEPNGQQKIDFSVGDSIGVSGILDVNGTITSCVFAVTVYTRTNVVVLNAIWPVEGGVQPGKYKFNISINNPNLRQDEYLVSCAFMKEFSDASNENLVIYARWNRALSFRIDEQHSGNSPLGLIRCDMTPAQGESVKLDRL